MKGGLKINLVSVMTSNNDNMEITFHYIMCRESLVCHRRRCRAQGTCNGNQLSFTPTSTRARLWWGIRSIVA